MKFENFCSLFFLYNILSLTAIVVDLIIILLYHLSCFTVQVKENLTNKVFFSPGWCKWKVPSWAGFAWGVTQATVSLRDRHHHRHPCSHARQTWLRGVLALNFTLRIRKWVLNQTTGNFQLELRDIWVERWHDCHWVLSWPSDDCTVMSVPRDIYFVKNKQIKVTVKKAVLCQSVLGNLSSSICLSTL